MANQNLSQFTEKTFVADADWTFVWDTAGAISKKVSRNNWLNSGELTTSAPVTISQTWNAVGQTFKALVVNAAGTSDANSASGSLLLDLQLNGVSKIYARKDGTLIAPTQIIAGTTGNAGQTVGVVANGIYLTGGTIYGPSSQFVIGPGTGISQNSVSYIAWGNGASSVGTVDTILLRDGAANTLALRNGTNAQTFRVYNTFPGTGNNEFGSFNWVDLANEFQISTGQAGTGTSRALCLRSAGGINFRIGGAPGTLVWQFGSTTGHLLAATDNSVDIGASGANRPRNVYVGSNVISRPSASITPANNSELVVEATSNTTLTFKLKGTDGTVRSGTITLA